ncbi:MAG TPA: asparagine synthase C-terminal domain-containing protein, partial [Chitinophagaceae bacterium]|nr:asparagine synthase C-terminal domain-containing protein [Chitinophagaceae bacterium]
KISYMYDEPFADSSQIPTFLVSELARQHVTVALSGDGGDELFAGYNRYTFVDEHWNKLSRTPQPIRWLMSSLLMSISPSAWDKLLFTVRNAGNKVHKLAGLMHIRTGMEFYQSVNAYWPNPDQLIRGSEPFDYHIRKMPAGLTLIEQMQFQDLLQYLPDDILTKVDRASMAVSLEARVPLLDHRIVEMSWQVPQALKKNKWALRQILYKHVPKQLIERPKMGFGVPIEDWMRGTIKEWTMDTLSEASINKDGLLNYAPIGKKLQEHMSGKRNWQYPLWGLLMFQDWYSNYRK